MTKYDFIREVSADTHLPKIQCEMIIDAFIEEMKDCLVAGDKVELSGFCIMSTKDLAPRKGYDVWNQEHVMKSGGRTVRCKFSSVFREEIKERGRIENYEA